MNELTFKELPLLLVSFAGAIFIAWYFIPCVVKVASIRNLTDRPGPRKIHKLAIPTLGGIAIYGGFTFGFLLTVDGSMKGVTYFMIATMLLFFTGIMDDLISINPRKKLVVQILAALIMIYFTDIRFTNFHGFMGVNAIPVWMTYVVTIFLIVVIINSLNLIDGIDGLAASTGIIASTAFGIWFWLSGDIGYTIMAVALAGALSAFLFFNISKGKNKIFMGDTGSLIIGFILAVMTIRFNEANNGGAAVYYNLSSAPAISMGILIIPLFDTLRVFTVRILGGHHPFTADNRHIHHLMLRAGFSHRRSTFYISVAHIFIIALSFLLNYIGILWLSLLLLLICTLLTGFVYLIIYKNYISENIVFDNGQYGLFQKLVIFNRAIMKRVDNLIPQIPNPIP